MNSITSKVELLAFTPNALEIIYLAARQCYFEGWVGDIWKDYPNIDNVLNDKDKLKKLISKVLKSGHTSVIEHVSFTFAISGISRSLSHQLVRHRIASYSQQSQRYCDINDFNFIIPPRIEKHEYLKEYYNNLMFTIKTGYEYLNSELKELYNDSKHNEDARYILPNACETKIVSTLNCRSLQNFFELRTCNRAQWEIRNLASQMLNICREKVPEIFNSMGPRCDELGYCPENISCGKYITKTK